MATERTMRVPVAAMTSQEYEERRKEFLSWKESSLVDGIDYGHIGGTSKPSLLQPGADKILLYFGLTAMPTLLEHVADPDSGYLYVVYRADGIDLETSRTVGCGVGAGSSYESHWRDVVDRVDGEISPGDGWEWAGVNRWERRRHRHASDVIALWNSVHKVVFKRARVALALSVSGLTEEFTQDMEDLRDVYGLTGEAPSRKPAEAKRGQKAKDGANGNGRTTEEQRGALSVEDIRSLTEWAAGLRKTFAPEMRSNSELFTLAFGTADPAKIQEPLAKAKTTLGRRSARHYTATRAEALGLDLADSEEPLNWAKAHATEPMTMTAIRNAIDEWFAHQMEDDAGEDGEGAGADGDAEKQEIEDKSKGLDNVILVALPVWAKAAGVDLPDAECAELVERIMTAARKEGVDPRQVLEDYFSIKRLRGLADGTDMDVYQVLATAKEIREQSGAMGVNEWMALLAEVFGAAAEAAGPAASPEVEPAQS